MILSKLINRINPIKTNQLITLDIPKNSWEEFKNDLKINAKKRGIKVKEII